MGGGGPARDWVAEPWGSRFGEGFGGGGGGGLAIARPGEGGSSTVAPTDSERIAALEAQVAYLMRVDRSAANVHIMSDEEAADWAEVEKLRREHPAWNRSSAGAGGSGMAHGPYTVRIWNGQGGEVIATGPTQAKATIAALRKITP